MLTSKRLLRVLVTTKDVTFDFESTFQWWNTLLHIWWRQWSISSHEDISNAVRTVLHFNMRISVLDRNWSKSASRCLFYMCVSFNFWWNFECLKLLVETRDLQLEVANLIGLVRSRSMIERLGREVFTTLGYE